jgi:hypothetical protein
MHKQRLLKLAGLLEKDAKRKTGVKFDLKYWGTTEKIKDLTEANCNTTACAIGLACVSGEFKRAGLDFRVEGNGAIVPMFEGDDEFGAVNGFFEIDQDESLFLFSDKSYPKKERAGAIGERAVAQRIRDFVGMKIGAPRLLQND